LDKVLIGNIETMELPFSEDFDHITFVDVLGVLKKVAPLRKSRLKAHGFNRGMKGGVSATSEEGV
jgi:hypothetical protein